MITALKQIINDGQTLARDAIPEDTLVGYCPYTARAATLAAEKHGFTADTIRGAFYDDPSQGAKPTDVSDIGVTYDGHWWCELHAEGTVYTIDLCSLLPSRHHEVLIMEGTPVEYIPLQRNPPRMHQFDP
ncbi:hypothetical protein [Salinibaculum rarum]|uniref:hypothetical protein n=1 Tax=Salinibaculum rarum TaxID=3058903 RepID=UPI00265EA464|nr:hypothetical protein [Salinibaculum sp. KK48]